MAAGEKLISQKEVCEPGALATQVAEAESLESLSSKVPWALFEKESELIQLGGSLLEFQLAQARERIAGSSRPTWSSAPDRAQASPSKSGPGVQCFMHKIVNVYVTLHLLFIFETGSKVNN